MSGVRGAALAAIADAVGTRSGRGRLRVGVDGVDGAGKTVFADELAELLRGRGVEVARVSVDGFHHPAPVRYRRGRGSADGFYEDSYDYERFTSAVLEPFGPGGDGRYLAAAYDVDAERPIEPSLVSTGEGAVLVIDGIFLHRPELRHHWDLSVFLDVPFEVSIPRGAARGQGSPDPDAPSNRRYIGGQQRYLRECTPQRTATFVIDNRDFGAPRIVAQRSRS